ncbi:gliding motility-associated C-terminal domain-containing protein [Myroides sp. LJL115]
MKKQYIYLSVFLLVCIGGPTVSFGQTSKDVFFNNSTISVDSQGVISTLYNFDNTQEGSLTNDGEIFYYRDFNNDGTYSFSSKAKSGKAIFMRYGQERGTQIISGDSFSEFYDVELNNATPIVAFDLKNNMDVHGTVDFLDGIIKIDSLENSATNLSYGMLSFQQGAKAVNVKDASHAEGMVEKIGSEMFQYPKGDKGLYRYARISGPKSVKDAFVGQYVLNDQRFFDSRPSIAGVINLLDTKEYWLVDKGSNTTSDILLTLSWDERTTPKELLVDPENELHIVRWDATEQLWVDEGGVVDLANKEITTVSAVKGYGFFTLATVKKDWILDGDVVIYNLVTPDGNGKNDYFIIDNINKYPNNTVEVYNRWGVRVFETSNYDPKGDGSVNVFNGFSQGRVTVDKNKMLPSGTYYYVVTYEYKDKDGSRMIKKAANLHLETN